jgi:hypothetical protein
MAATAGGLLRLAPVFSVAAAILPTLPPDADGDGADPVVR